MSRVRTTANRTERTRSRDQSRSSAGEGEPRLTWSDTRWRDEPLPPPPPIEPYERNLGTATTGSADEPSPHRFVFGDALDVARALAAEGLRKKVDLVYIDPPFASQADYLHEVRLDGRADGRVRRILAYEDTNGIGAYLEDLAPRLRALVDLLSPRGTLWVHLDWRASYLVRVLLDELVGRDRFLNEIVWRRAPNLGRQATSHQFGRTLDTLLVYGGREARLVPPTRLEPIEPSAIRFGDDGRPFTTAPRGDYTDVSIERLDKEGRIHRTPSGRVYIKYFLEKNEDGEWCRERRVDALWTDVPPLRHVALSERTGYPTQKPRALLERIITCSTPKGGLVVDVFSGSGTTAEAAHVTGRRAIVGDRGPVSLATTRARLLRAGAPLTIETCGTMPPEGTEKIRVRVTREAAGGRVSLVGPKDVQAWALDTRKPARTSRGNEFVSSFHAERRLGSKPLPPALEAVVDSLPETFRARVYTDEGTVLSSEFGASSSRPSRTHDANGGTAR